MLSTTCWVIIGPSLNSIDGKVYLHKADAKAALPILQGAESWKTTPLSLAERILVLAFGVTDRKITPESLTFGRPGEKQRRPV